MLIISIMLYFFSHRKKRKVSRFLSIEYFGKKKTTLDKMYLFFFSKQNKTKTGVEGSPYITMKSLLV